MYTGPWLDVRHELQLVVLIQVTWLMICWWPLSSGHKYYITVIYLILQWYCWNYKSKLIEIYKIELYIAHSTGKHACTRWSNSHNTIYELYVRLHFIILFYCTSLVFRITPAHRVASHIGIPSRCTGNWTALTISSWHHNFGMFAN